MSIRLALTVKRLPDVELIDRGFWLVRVLCDVRFPLRQGLSDPYPAIIDTGAPTSIIPLSLWSQTHVRRLKPFLLQGLVARKECAISVTAGIIGAVLEDLQGRQLRRSFRTYLAQTDEVPLILGMQDMLEDGKVFLDLKAQTAWLEFP
ncbi:MAG: hypothetical protein Q8R91_06770 [Candidatus Omnitrophota bacterium]|nr:hypothetical protein [Candidatus Omnitrophota bacterium]